MPLSPVDHARKRLSEAVRLLEGFPDLVRTLEEIRERLARTLLVAVVGEYNSGKSTFLNAVMGRRVLPTGALPTTACVNYIKHGKVPSVTIYYRDGTDEPIDPQKFEELTAHDHKDPAQAVRLRLIHHMDVFDEAAILEHVVFADTPGLNAPTEADREITETLLEESDAILWLTSARQVLSGTEVGVLKKYGKRYRGKSICIISQTDTVGDDAEIALLKQHAGETLGGYFLDIVPLSARRALDGRTEELSPFFNSFWHHIVPRAQEFVVENGILDASRAIEETTEDLDAERTRLIAARSRIADAESKAVEAVRRFLTTLDRTIEDMRKESRRIRDALADEVFQNRLTTWTDKISFTKTIEGVFVDDQVVAHREVLRWTIPLGAVMPLDVLTKRKFKDAVSISRNACHAHLADAGEMLGTINTKILSDNRDIPGGALVVDTAPRTAFARRDIETFFDSIVSYFDGAMDHAGMGRFRDQLHSERSIERPTRVAIAELIDRFVPLERIHGRLGELGKLHQAVRESLCRVYPALLSEIDERIAVRTGKISRLNSAKDAIAADRE
ncbi:MAG: dynamin family protein [Pseudomonadota bacterium]